MNDRRWLRLGAALQVATLLLVVGLGVPSSASPVMPVDEQRTLHEGEYSWVLLYGGGYPEDMEIDVAWNSSVPIDVWLMDRTQWDRYESGSSFTFDMNQSGTSGAIRFSAPGARLVNGSFYVVLDHTARGPTQPPPTAGDTVSNVTVTGGFWRPDPQYTPDPGGMLFLDSIKITAVVIPVALVVIYVILKLRKRDRAEVIRKDLTVGKVVGEGAEKFAQPPAIGPQAAQARPPAHAPAAPPPYYAPQGWAPAAPAGHAPYGPPPPAVCRSCGSPLRQGISFCGSCGSRV